MAENKVPGLDGLAATAAVQPLAIIQEYYAAFNDRRFMDAAALVADDAMLDQLPLRSQERGRIGYLQFVSMWLGAFPDASLTQRHVSSDGAAVEVDLTLTGTHHGALHLGDWVFRPTGTPVTLHLRELLQIREGRIVFASVSFDLHELVESLTICDVPALLGHLRRLHVLTGELAQGPQGAASVRNVIHRIGQELDAARQVVRPYYKR